MIVVFGQRVEAEALGDALHAPRLRHRLEATHEQLARVFLVVGAFVLHAQHRQVARQAVDGLGDDVEVLGGVQGHGHADVGRQAVRPHAGAEHHGVRCNVAGFGFDADGAPFSTRMRSTLVFSKIFAPRCLAPLASACVVSIGLVWPSPGRKMPPTTSPTSSNGQRSLISPGVSSSMRRPNVLPIDAPRCSSSSRAAVLATLIEPFCLNPVAWPVSASSEW